MYFPSGEGLAQMQERAMRAVHGAIESKKKGATVFVSHGDVIKSIVASALGMHLDGFQRIVIDPASVSVIDFSGGNPRVILLNDSRAELEGFINAPYRKRNLLGGGAGK
jgi:probable phosphoglycerate mutase